MKTWNRFLNAGFGLLLLSVFTFMASSAMAQTVSLLSTETFGSGIPSTWSNPTGSWYSSTNGNGGSNGSAVCNIYDYYSPEGLQDVLKAPSVNASGYTASADSVLLDFDFCFEDSYYDVYYGDDQFEVLANSDVLLSGSTTALKTYTYSNYGYDVNPPTASGDWVHYHLVIPAGDRTSNLVISFIGIAGPYGATNPAIDNVSITATLPPGKLSVLPSSLDFGAATPNSPDTLCTTAYNTGSGTLTITGYYFSGAPGYSLVSGPPPGTTIAPGGSAQYCIQFLPLAGGVLSGSFTLNTDAGNGPQSVTLTGIGAVPEVSYGVTTLFRRVATMLADTSAEQYIPVTSTGGGPLHFNSIYFIGLDASSYFVSRMPQNPLPVGVTDSIGIRLSPTIEGRPDASVVISTDAANKPLDTVSLFGIGALPHLVITVPSPGSGNTVMFDSVALGDSVCQTLTLTNPGTDTLLILKQLVTYGDYDFSYYPLMGADTIIVPGGGTKLVNVCFRPLKVGTRLASIRFYTNIPRTFDKPSLDTSQFVVNVTGIGVPFGQLTVLGSLNDTAVVGRSNCLTDTLVNKGQADLTISKETLTGPEASAFALTGATPSFTLSPGEMKIVSLCFTAATRGTQVDTLLLSGTTAEKSVTSVLLLNGVGVMSCVSADSMIAFGQTGMTLVGEVDTTCITVSNCGDIATKYTAAAPTGAGYTLVPPMTTAVIPAGGTAQFCIVFQPSAIGAVNGSITISGGPSPTTTLLGGVGAGVAASASGAPSGPVSIGNCQNFDVTVTNNGNVAWTPGTPTIGGANASDFTVVSGPTPSTIAATGTATVTIKFCPTTQGSESMTLTFPSESPTPVAGAFSYSTTGVGAASGVALKTEQDGFTLGASYPNPTNGSAEIAVTLPYEAPVRIDLIDATGAIVQNAFTGRLRAGTQTVSIDAKGLPSGTYFYLLTSGDVRLTRQMSLIK